MESHPHGPYVLLHVQHCAFRVHWKLLAARSRRLWELIDRLVHPEHDDNHTQTFEDIAAASAAPFHLQLKAWMGSQDIEMRDGDDDDDDPSHETRPRMTTLCALTSKAKPAEQPGGCETSCVVCVMHCEHKGFVSSPRSSSVHFFNPSDDVQGSARDLEVELCNADPQAVASMVEFWHTDDVVLRPGQQGLNVVRLLRWLALGDKLLYRALAVAIEQLSVHDWLDLVIFSSTLRLEHKRQRFVRLLLRWIANYGVATASANRRHPVLSVTTLAAIEDEGILTQTALCIMNYVRHMTVWTQLVDELETWMRWTLGRRFDTRAPISLVELHHQHASWSPYIQLPLVDVSGVDAYIRPATLFTFGPYAFQVRYSVEWAKLMQWRVVQLPNDSGHMTTSSASFTLRGQLSVGFRCSVVGTRYERTVPIRFTNSTKTLGVWNVLVGSPTPLAREDEGVQYVRATFCGNFFIWSTMLCNLYHYLLLSTVFYDEHARKTLDRLPVDTLVMLLRSDRLRIPEGETALLQALHHLLFDKRHTYSHDQMRSLLSCVRWKYVDLEQVLDSLAASPRSLGLYELIEDALVNEKLLLPRRDPWGEQREWYKHVVTTHVEFQIEAGDRGLTPDSMPFPAVTSIHDSTVKAHW